MATSKMYQRFPFNTARGAFSIGGLMNLSKELPRTMGHARETATRVCVFCAIVAGESPADVVREWADAVAIVPIDPVVDGHVIVLPRCHVADAVESPSVTADVMRRAAELAGECGDSNLLTSVGPAATQTVFHLHIHVVPRRFGDGLVLPWTPTAADGAGTTRKEN
jgi:histidine triad (HIT) family protein